MAAATSQTSKERLAFDKGFTFADSLHDIESGKIINKDRLIDVKEQGEVKEALHLCVQLNQFLASLGKSKVILKKNVMETLQEAELVLAEEYHTTKRRSLIFESKRSSLSELEKQPLHILTRISEYCGGIWPLLRACSASLLERSWEGWYNVHIKERAPIHIAVPWISKLENIRKLQLNGNEEEIMKAMTPTAKRSMSTLRCSRIITDEVREQVAEMEHLKEIQVARWYADETAWTKLEKMSISFI